MPDSGTSLAVSRRKGHFSIITITINDLANLNVSFFCIVSELGLTAPLCEGPKADDC